MSMAENRKLTIFVAHPSDVLTDHLPHGDGLVTFGFIRRLAERGHELHVAAQRVELRDSVPSNLHVYRLSPRGGTSSVSRLMFMARMRVLFERLRRRVTFDIVHQMNPVFTGLSLSLIGTRPPLVLGTFIPRSWESEGDHPSQKPSWTTQSRNRLRLLVDQVQQAQAAGLLLASPRALSRISEPQRHVGRIHEVPYGIDLTQFIEREHIPARPSILFLANVVYRKGVFTLLDSFDKVLRFVPNAELVIAGGGDELEQVRRRVEAMPHAGIKLIGPVERDRVAGVMREHSVYCLPSYGEPFGMSVLEAMGCGLPIVATRAGGIPDLVTTAGGRLVPPRDPRALADALIEVLTSTDLQRQMGRHNRVRVETHFDISIAVDRLERAYAAVIGGVSANDGGEGKSQSTSTVPGRLEALES
jgi:glycosyltransferase involved in cell wall biosynthesis